MNIAQRGLWSGTIATSAMTLGFLELFRDLPENEKSPVPPGTITTDLLKKFSAEDALNSEGRQAAALLAHYGYGTVFAMLYAAMADKSKSNGLVKGTAFGLGVWGFSYLGLLPALGMRSQAPNMPAKRNLMLIALHIVWGACLGFTEERLRLHGKEMFDGKLKNRERSETKIIFCAILYFREFRKRALNLQA